MVKREKGRRGEGGGGWYVSSLKSKVDALIGHYVVLFSVKLILTELWYRAIVFVPSSIKKESLTRCEKNLHKRLNYLKVQWKEEWIYLKKKRKSLLSSTKPPFIPIFRPIRSPKDQHKRRKICSLVTSLFSYLQSLPILRRLRAHQDISHVHKILPLNASCAFVFFRLLSVLRPFYFSRYPSSLAVFFFPFRCRVPVAFLHTGIFFSVHPLPFFFALCRRVVDRPPPNGRYHNDFGSLDRQHLRRAASSDVHLRCARCEHAICFGWQERDFSRCFSCLHKKFISFLFVCPPPPPLFWGTVSASSKLRGRDVFLCESRRSREGGEGR